MTNDLKSEIMKEIFTWSGKDIDNEDKIINISIQKSKERVLEILDDQIKIRKKFEGDYASDLNRLDELEFVRKKIKKELKNK